MDIMINLLRIFTIGRLSTLWNKLIIINKYQMSKFETNLVHPKPGGRQNTEGKLIDDLASEIQKEGGSPVRMN